LLLVVWTVVSLVTLLIELVPGDPAVAVLGEQATAEQFAQFREKHGLDRPPFFFWFPEDTNGKRHFRWYGVNNRYTDYWRGLLHGDLGLSFRNDRPVVELIFERYPATIELAIAALLIAVAILATLMCVLFCALLELFQDVRQMRDALAILDRPAPIDIGRAAGTAPSAYGLPPQLDAAKGALLLFLSDKCSTCRVLAATIGGSMAAGLWIVVEASSPHAAELFVENYGLAQGIEDHRVIIDPAGTIAGQLRLNTTPVAYRMRKRVLAKQDRDRLAGQRKKQTAAV